MQRTWTRVPPTARQGPAFNVVKLGIRHSAGTPRKPLTWSSKLVCYGWSSEAGLSTAHTTQQSDAHSAWGADSHSHSHTSNGQHNGNSSNHSSDDSSFYTASARGFFDDTPDFFSGSTTSASKPASTQHSPPSASEYNAHSHADNGGFFSRWDSWDNTGVNDNSAAMEGDSTNGSTNSFFSSSHATDSSYRSWESMDSHTTPSRGGTFDDDGSSAADWLYTSTSANGRSSSNYSDGYSSDSLFPSSHFDQTLDPSFFQGADRGDYYNGDDDNHDRFRETDTTEEEGTVEDDAGGGGGFFTDAFKMAFSQALERASDQGEAPFVPTAEAEAPLPMLPSRPKREAEEPSALEEVLAAAMDASMTSLNRLMAIKGEVDRSIEREKVQLARLEFALDKAKKDEAYYRVLRILQERGKSDLED